MADFVCEAAGTCAATYLVHARRTAREGNALIVAAVWQTTGEHAAAATLHHDGVVGRAASICSNATALVACGPATVPRVHREQTDATGLDPRQRGAHLVCLVGDDALSTQSARWLR